MKYQNIWKHLCLVSHHKWEVLKLCCVAGIPIRGLLHDLSKFSPSELFESIRYYNGHRSPLAVSREINGYSKAWLHHKGRNKHHWEYWIDGYTINAYGCIIPFRYACEMICDMIAASKVYKGNAYTKECPLRYFEAQNYGPYVNPHIQDFMRAVFTAYALEGTKAVQKQNLKRLYQLHVTVPVSEPVSPSASDLLP